MRTNLLHPTLENHGRRLANLAAAQEIEWMLQWQQLFRIGWHFHNKGITKTSTECYSQRTYFSFIIDWFRHEFNNAAHGGSPQGVMWFMSTLSPIGSLNF